jgi:hypothetical protein
VRGRPFALEKSRRQPGVSRKLRGGEETRTGNELSAIDGRGVASMP